MPGCDPVVGQAREQTGGAAREDQAAAREDLFGTDDRRGARALEGIAQKACADVVTRQLEADDLPGGPAGDRELEAAGATVEEATQLLWNTYHPYMVWYYLGAFGLLGTIGMTVFYFVIRKKA